MADDFVPANVFGSSAGGGSMDSTSPSSRETDKDKNNSPDDPMASTTLLGGTSKAASTQAIDSDDDDLYMDIVDAEESGWQKLPSSSTGGDNPLSSHVIADDPPMDTGVDAKRVPLGAGKASSAAQDLDLSHSIKGLYRILDLISEQGSGGGLVDKIIISQDTLQAFANDVQPGSFTSLTKVDFKLLDNVLVKPLGIYGDKRAIAEYLERVGAVGNDISTQLLKKEDERGSGSPSLRSGLYILRVSAAQLEDNRVYVIYWPEDTTWDDNAISSVRRNRITFMRYLSKICDQTMALMSGEYAQAIVWKETEDDDTYMDSDDEGSERMYAFEVCKTNEQEESVKVRPGFTTPSYSIMGIQERPDGMPEDLNMIQPRLIYGEAVQGLITACYKPAKEQVESFNDRPMNKTRLENFINDRGIRLSFDDLDPRSVVNVLECNLKARCPPLCRKFNNEKTQSRQQISSDFEREKSEALDRLTQDLPRVTQSLRDLMIDEILKEFPTLERERLQQSPSTSKEDIVEGVSLETISAMYSRAQSIFEKARIDKQLETLGNQLHGEKEKVLVVAYLFDTHEGLDEKKQVELVDMILHNDDIKRIRKVWVDLSKGNRVDEKSRGLINGFISSLKALVPTFDASPTGEDTFKDAINEARRTLDSEFVANLGTIASRWPVLEEAVDAVTSSIYDHFNGHLRKLSTKYAHETLHIQQEDCAKWLNAKQTAREEQAERDLCSVFISELNQHFANVSSKQEFHVQMVVDDNSPYSRNRSFRFTGYIATTEDPKIEYSVYPMHLTTEERHNIQLDPSFIPTPRPGLAHSFSLPMGNDIIYLQFLENEDLLFITSDRMGNVQVYCEPLDALERAINHVRYKKQLSHDKIGDDFLITFNESKQTLAVFESQKLQLHIFVFDEGARALKASGSTINLAPWYDGTVTIRHACFICGDEEVLLVDSNARGRIFSLLTMQFRPASLQFASMPTAIQSSPDGSCFLAFIPQDSSFRITAYHWATFGSNEGTQLAINDLGLDDDCVLTSFGSRNSVHLMKLDTDPQNCRSFALDITRKSTEFTFRAKGGTAASSTEKGNGTLHNCLVDCHSDVWTRFPVLPAVQRQAITRASSRHSKSLTFVSDFGQRRFEPHFSELIQTFERTTRKLSGNELRSIAVTSITFNDFYAALGDISSFQTSEFRAGEWLVELLCLIPIHLAVTKDNRFIPLKDGVFSPELEKSLLGAEVGRIVDALSFGWYESIFQSYMASKPVKVVSSMGEQSVGKSFMLNHLADTSFAGSAMRTTEGVWMSVAPTEDALIVALDFEGVHSIERSAQEDTLLVLFNTAISNLVLFRNNFALSRDITGLFQSFQSSSTVLDPAANPMLFQSTLVIIIKDVVDSDKMEITREFSLKFHKIVQDEQESNFISRLHGGKLDIIPWPVIESKEFYKLFPKLKKRLDQQNVTHQTAGQFLHTAKTLMAKLKANDWGALSHTMASHRALLLRAMLSNALESGFIENGAEKEPLKNLDTDEFIAFNDTPAVFSVSSGDSGREARLAALERTWVRFSDRQHVADEEWLEGLASHLNQLLSLRIDRVRDWISSNLARFQAVSHESMEELKREFENSTVDMRSNIQLCGGQCVSCHLQCIQSRLHQGLHDCKTDHKCTHDCNFCEDEDKMCGMNAGHPGKHICVVASHLCGEPCDFSGKQGCLEACTKVIDHEDDEHRCAAPVHACGKPCDLEGIGLPDGSAYSCPGTCSVSSDREHTQHRCETRMCPISCLLCKRLCSHADHLHGLHRGAIHLCGQEHSCNCICSRQGICEIDTAPLSIEATFTGRHETFQYTKYSQVNKRLKCVKPIPAGATEHTGDHTHSMDSNVIHFCEKRCEHCGYFCTQPLGHPQPEHETRHGSMSQTRWAIDGDEGTTIEVEGRRYAANDDGAPMMCNLVCQSMGRHTHFSYCRSATAAECAGNDQIQHISKRMNPDPNRPKDFITHGLFWGRSGFKDPYSREEQANFAKCDAMCGGPEHTAPGAMPSYCTLPMFHPPRDPTTAPATGYVSSDGHMFTCRNPVVLQQAFHVIFAIDRSGSMGSTDRTPLRDTPTSAQISRNSNNRLGAVLSAVYSFWAARHAAITAGGHQANMRRDSYSVILFESDISTALVNDFGSSPEQLLNMLLPYRARGGTNFTGAIRQAQAIMEGHWSTERTPVVVFLSDGECHIEDTVTQDLCRSAIRLGKPVSLQTVSFGPDRASMSLRRMAQIAADAQATAQRDPLAPAAASIISAFSQALDSVQLADTFLGIAESLKKQRGSLIN
ncbi:hypothetical protein CONPUDRAFT_82336 [Coniophora puteana RWD-64-598 SS2]|uniref:VWFA domain-containing protein n=1 Tax=Coniophora puteana (strain RWD-64-598) TaxID=741705 RepID=A0A5M3MS23_CONPW|nr:uncharacterized protein CONPUDRAFT_82336 [Coniophora puteana RWD-64-598 SS2]EIW81351.1 hypothetical protein CONPUDRAFT_82336 [Coniophora puteana RWD-64-598 SS2]